MSAASNYLEDEVLDHVLGEGARDYTPSTTLHIALFSGTASDVLAALEAGTNAATAGNWGYYEINTGSYARTAVNFAAASGGSATTSGDVTFPPATANYDNTAGSGSTVTCIAVVDNGTSGQGNVLFYGQLDNSKEILNGDTFQVSTGNLTISLA
jgi:hypothetical protein